MQGSAPGGVPMTASAGSTFASAYAFLVGACVGSFLNVCIARWPAGLSVVRPRSRCPRCERPIRAYENVPILGWVMLRGRCAGCGTSISLQYPLVELAVALLWGATVWHYGATFLALRVAVFLTLLGGVAITDAKHYLIPDGFTLFGFVWVFATACIAVFLQGGDGSLRELSSGALAAPSVLPFGALPQSPFATPYEALIGACTGAGAIALTGWLGEVMLEREAMGFGDVTLMAVAGAALGPERTLLTIFVAAAIGAVVFMGVVYPTVWMSGKLRHERGEGILGDEGAAVPAGPPLDEEEGKPTLPLVPFGVFLAPAAVFSLFWGAPLIHWYTSTFLGV